MVESQPTIPPQPPTRSYRIGQFIAALMVIGIPFGIAVLVYRAYPAHHVEKKNPSFLDAIFANNIVLFAARLVLLSTALVLAVVASYVIYSIIANWKGGLKLAKFGPFHVQEAEDLSADVAMWRDAWIQANEENTQLRDRLEATDALLAEAFDTPDDEEPEEGTEPPGLTS